MAPLAMDPASTPPFNLPFEADRFFDDSSRPTAEPPQFVLLLGGVASGKSYTRRRKYKQGFVVLDAGEIFISLSRGGYYDFPGPFALPLNEIGARVARRAVDERRSIVTEMLATDRQRFETVVHALVALGYKAQVVWIDCDIEEGARRNAARGDYDISAFFCQDYHHDWLMDAARAAPTAS